MKLTEGMVGAQTGRLLCRRFPNLRAVRQFNPLDIFTPRRLGNRRGIFNTGNSLLQVSHFTRRYLTRWKLFKVSNGPDRAAAPGLLACQNFPTPCRLGRRSRPRCIQTPSLRNCVTPRGRGCGSKRIPG